MYIAKMIFSVLIGAWISLTIWKAPALMEAYPGLYDGLTIAVIVGLWMRILILEVKADERQRLGKSSSGG